MCVHVVVVLQKAGDNSLRLPQRAQVAVQFLNGVYPADVVFIGKLSSGKDVAIVQAYNFVYLRAPNADDENDIGGEGARHRQVPSCPYVWLTNEFSVVDPSAIVAPALLVPDLDMTTKNALGEMGLLDATPRPCFFWAVHVTPHVIPLIP
jgi:hypothetical protein